MRSYSEREVALFAELLADKLISVYQNEEVGLMVENFASVGFTQTALKQDPVKLFQMLVVATYDRRPFTGAAGGFEVIWGMHRTGQSIPDALKALSLFSPDDIRPQDDETIRRQLAGRPYFDHSLATDGAHVDFSRTLRDVTRLIDDGFHDQLLKASTASDVRGIYKTLTIIHGIGDTIGAKRVKYLLREINVGKVHPSEFPLTVVWPITAEYHASEATERLSHTLGVTLVPLAMGLLLNRGEPFAIDALFYLHRQRKRDLDEFIKDTQAIGPGPKPRPTPPPLRGPVAPPSDWDVAQELLAVIKEIYDGSLDVTPADVKRVGLEGVVTGKQIQRSARWLHVEMGKLAAEGNAAGMVDFYHNCLQTERGRHIGWALSLLGRKSMESEADRFRAICEGRSAAE